MIEPRTRDYKKDLYEELINPQFAAKYLNAVCEDGTQEEILLALRNICEAHKMSTVSRKAKIDRKGLYIALSSSGNPTLSTIMSIFKETGLRLAVQAAK